MSSISVLFQKYEERFICTKETPYQPKYNADMVEHRDKVRTKVDGIEVNVCGNCGIIWKDDSEQNL